MATEKIPREGVINLAQARCENMRQYMRTGKPSVFIFEKLDELIQELEAEKEKS